MVSKDKLESWRRNPAYRAFSREIPELVSDIGLLYNQVKKESIPITKKKANSYRGKVSSLRKRKEGLEGRVRGIRFQNLPVDPTNLNEIPDKYQVISDFVFRPGVEFSTVLANLNELLDQTLSNIKRKIKAPEEEIGIDASSGNIIFFDKRDGDYNIRHPKTNKLIKEVSALKLTYTAAIETRGGNEDFVAEITAFKDIRGKNRDDLSNIESKVDNSVKDYIKDKFDKAKIDKAKEEGDAVSSKSLLSEKIKPEKKVEHVPGIIKEAVEYEPEGKPVSGRRIKIEVEKKEKRQSKMGDYVDL